MNISQYQLHIVLSPFTDTFPVPALVDGICTRGAQYAEKGEEGRVDAETERERGARVVRASQSGPWIMIRLVA